MISSHGDAVPLSALDDALFEEFRAIIHRHSGISFEANKRYLLESRLMQRLHVTRAGTYAAYRDHLLSPAGAGEIHALTNAVTINETYFFRHPAHLEFFEHRIVPALVRSRAHTTTPLIRIWSAACASGDEPYSIALLLRDRIQPMFPRVTFEIVATDIDSSILAAAERGSYAPYAVRNVPPDLLTRYFAREGDRYVLDPRVRDMVRFRQLNLNDEQVMRGMRGFDVILCANVLIYFDVDAKKRSLSLLHDALNRDGYLFIGFSETLFGVTDAFVAERFDRTLVYRRTDRPAPTPDIRPASNILPISHEATTHAK